MKQWVWVKNPKGVEVEVSASRLESLLKQGYEVAGPSVLKFNSTTNIKADINLITILSHSCGYSNAAEQLVLGLQDIGYKVKVISHESKRIDYSWMTDRFKKVVKEGYQEADKTIIFTPPIFMRPHHKIGETFAYTMFETESIEPEAVDILNYYNGVIVTCEHNVKSFERSGVKHDIKKAHLSIDFDFYGGKPIPHRGFTFYSHGTHSKRKGTDLLIRAFEDTFAENEPVKLVIKNTPIGAKNFPVKSNHSGIRHIVSNISPTEIKEQILISDCGVFPSRGEGWGMGAMECMAAGLPVILTDYGGHSEQANKKYNYPLKVDHLTSSHEYFVPLSSRYKALGDWAEPDLGHLKKLMRFIYENKNQGRKKGRLAKNWISKKFSREKQANLIALALDLDQYQFIKNPLR